jgi:polar amino acid transport system substrate-binding protein
LQGRHHAVSALIGRAVAGLDPETQQALAPTGRLRVGIAVGTAVSATWAKRDAAGRPSGPTVDIAERVAASTGLPLQLVEYGSSGDIIKASASGEWDVSFTPVDAERKAIVDFGPAFALGESTYMVPKGSTIATLADVNRAGIRVYGVEGTATLRAAAKSLTGTKTIGLKGLDDVMTKFKSGEADAIALGKESLLSIAADFPGARILDGHFLALATALAVPKGHSVALEVFGTLLEELKADGTVRKIFDRYGMTSTTVAPAGYRA